MNLDLLFQFATSFYKGVKGVKQIVWFSPLLYPSIAGGGALERILEAKLLSPIYANPQEALGTVPLRRMVVVVNPRTYLHVYSCFAVVMAGGMFLFLLSKG